MRLVEGKTELLLRLDIVKKLDITVVFGRDHFRVGQEEFGYDDLRWETSLGMSSSSK